MIYDVESKLKFLLKRNKEYSDAYIDYLFDNCVDHRYVEYISKEDDIRAAIVGVPCEFNINIDGDNNIHDSENVLKALYLIPINGSRTDLNFHNFSELLNKINNKASADNISFTFIYTNRAGLQEFYKKNNYVNCGFKFKNLYFKDYKFCDYNVCNSVNVISLKEVQDENNIDSSKLIQDIITYVNHKNENKTISQIITNELLNLLIKSYDNPNGDIIISKSNVNNKINGIAFSKLNIYGDTEIRYLKYDNKNIRAALLTHISDKIKSNTGIEVFESEKSEKYQIIGEYVNEDSEKYSEGKIHEPDEVFSRAAAMVPTFMMRICKLSEILKFAAACKPDRKYSILVNDEKIAQNSGLYLIKGGKMQFKPLHDLSDAEISVMKHSSRLEDFILPIEVLSALLMRRPHAKEINDFILLPEILPSVLPL